MNDSQVTEQTISHRYRPDIDGLRAFAVMPVLLYHFGIEQVSGGFAGVDVFFVISGYLIAGSLLNDLDRGRFSIIDFYWRRFRRILPALFVTLVLSALTAYFLLPPKQFAHFGWSVLASMTFWSNIYFWDTIDYFSVSAELTPLLHTWSLAVEEQFYIFAPIVMYLVYRFLHRKWLYVLLPLILLSFAASVYGLQNAPRFTFYWLPTRAWELMLGAFLALCPLPLLNRRWLVELTGLSGFACLFVGYFTLTESSAFPGVGALLPCFGAFLIIYAGEHRKEELYPMSSRLLEVAPFVMIGKISYSLYLVHWPLVSFATHYYLRPVEAPIILTLISIVLATASWKWIEQPFRNSAALSGKKPAFVFAASATVICVFLSTVVIQKDGFPGRPADYVTTKVETVFWRNRSCFFQNGQSIFAFSTDKCVHDLGFENANILLWGDSYAAQYVAGLETNAATLGSNVLQITHAGCPPILSYQSSGVPACAQFNRKAFELAQNGEFSVVILAALWDVHDGRKLMGLEETLQKLKALGVKVIVVGQSPRFMDNVQRLAARVSEQDKGSWNYPVHISEHTLQTLKAQTQKAQQVFVNPISLLCYEGACPLRDEVDFMAFDNGHMGKRGASIALDAYLRSFLTDGQTLQGWAQNQ